MDKLEVGMYVRTKNQGIFIISHINITFDDSDFRKVCLCQNEKVVFADVNTIKELKISHNIIDLIEVGDHVNGVMVESMNNSIKPTPIPQYKNERGEYFDFDESDIKSIVTKEQFSNMEYRIGD